MNIFDPVLALQDPVLRTAEPAMRSLAQEPGPVMLAPLPLPQDPYTSCNSRGTDAP